jgi:hypothetical protein
MHNPGETRRGIAESYLELERRHCEERFVRRSSTSECGADGYLKFESETQRVHKDADYAAGALCCMRWKRSTCWAVDGRKRS